LKKGGKLFFTIILCNNSWYKRPFHIKALFTHPLKLIEAELEWIDDLINEIKEDKNAY